MVGSMTTMDTTDTAHYDRAVSRAHATVTRVLGDGGRVGEDPPPGWRPVAGDSAVRNG